MLCGLFFLASDLPLSVGMVIVCELRLRLSVCPPASVLQYAWVCIQNASDPWHCIWNKCIYSSVFRGCAISAQRVKKAILQ
jgi:hypothetical protein